MEEDFLKSTLTLFRYYKQLGDQTMAQLSDAQLRWQYHPASNSIAQIVKHLSGNMKSRWTSFLTSDGEKEWRNREQEFDNDLATRAAVEASWNEGWDCLFQALATLTAGDLGTTVYIRNQGHTVLEAIHRQLAHYPYHIGQLVFLGKMLCGDQWQSLSIPKGHSDQYNALRFGQAKQHRHFTEDFR